MKYILVRLENNNQPKWKPKEVRKLRVIRETEEFYVVDDGEPSPPYIQNQLSNSKM